jgi:hypothetical protein
MLCNDIFVNQQAVVMFLTVKLTIKVDDKEEQMCVEDDEYETSFDVKDKFSFAEYKNEDKVGSAKYKNDKNDNLAKNDNKAKDEDELSVQSDRSVFSLASVNDVDKKLHHNTFRVLEMLKRNMIGDAQTQHE